MQSGGFESRKTWVPEKRLGSLWGYVPPQRVSISNFPFAGLILLGADSVDLKLCNLGRTRDARAEKILARP